MGGRSSKASSLVIAAEPDREDEAREDAPSSSSSAAAHSASRAGALDVAREVFAVELDALRAVAARLDERFDQACQVVLGAKGRVVTLGMGKSGLVARKVAATLSSTGTPAFFVHPAEAFHGDLGMLQAGDVAFMFSKSGETEELVRMVPFLQDRHIPIVAAVARTPSSLSRHALVVLDVAVPREACSLNLAPTSSTTAALVMGDALAVALAKMRGFEPADFQRFHPGGYIGQRLLARVRDVMHTGALPTCAPDARLHHVLHVMSAGRLGLALVLVDGTLRGIITDGDVRRAVENSEAPLDLEAADIMTSVPQVARPDERFADAELRMLERKINSLVVVDDRGFVVGIVQIYGARGPNSRGLGR
jgi:arabinose-5-phosphate isomerase